MKKSRFSEEQIIHILREAEGGQTVQAVCARHNLGWFGRRLFVFGRLLAGIVLPAPILWPVAISFFEKQMNIPIDQRVSSTNSFWIVYFCVACAALLLIGWYTRKRIKESLERTAEPPVIHTYANR